MTLAQDSDRAHLRHRRIALSAVASALSKAVSVLSLFVSVPLAVHYLGQERYGLWVTMTSVIMWLGVSDLGLGPTLVNAVARAKARSEPEHAARLVATGFWLLVAIGVLLILALASSYRFVSWTGLFNVPNQALAQEVGPAFTGLLLCFAIGLPLSCVAQVQSALQEGYVASAWSAVGTVLGLLGLGLAIWTGANLTWLVASVALGPVLAAAANALNDWGRRRPELRPRLGNFRRALVKELLGRGSLFILMQISVAVVFNSDNFIAAQLFGLESVTAYTVPQRLFSLCPLVLNFFFTPLWPAYHEAKTKGDVEWVKRTFRRSLLTAFGLSVPAAIVGILAAPWFVAHWVGPDLQIPRTLILGLGLACVQLSVAGALGMFLNGLDVIGPQAVLGILNALGSLGFKWWLCQRFGIAGLAFGTVASTLCFVHLPYIWLIRQSLRDLPRESSPQARIASSIS